MLTAEQLEARRHGIGGSDIAAICGLPGAFGSPITVYLEKIGASEPEDQNEYMYWGNKHERAIIERFSEEHPEYVVSPYNGVTERHVMIPFALATPDAWLLDRSDTNAIRFPIAGLECKTASEYKRHQWDGNDVPIAYMAQVQWYMGVTEVPLWYIAVLIGGNKYKEYEVRFDEDFFIMLLERAEAFWELVETRTPPPLDASPGSADLLKALYPADAVLEDVIELPRTVDGVDIDWLVQERQQIKNSIEELKTRLTLCENRLKLAIADHQCGVTPNGCVVTYKPRERKSIDVKRLHEEQPEIAEAYEKVSTFRVLDVKEADDGEQG